MKNRIILLTLLSVLLLSSSCKKFLENEPKDFLSPDNYFRNEAEVKSALAGVYVTLGSEFTYGRHMVVDGAMDDLGYWNQSEVNIIDRLASWNYTSAQPQIMMMWQRLYEGIERANVLLENINKAEMDEAKRAKYIGEIRFLRAYYHYLLTDLWGDIPVRLQSNQTVTDVNIPQTSAKEVLQMVVTEMEEVINNNHLEAASVYNHSSRVSITVAQAILARVYIKMAGEPLKIAGSYEKALSWANKVKDSGLHKLNPNYDEIFTNHSKNLFDIQYRESMWEADFTGNPTTDPGKGDKYSWIGVTNGIICYDESDALGYSYGYIRIRLKLWDLFEEFDKRKYRSIAPHRYNVTNGQPYNQKLTTFTAIADRCSAKWRREEETLRPKVKNNNETNFPIIRYSDVLLMIAEAENEINGASDIALEAINEVRTRAGVKPYATTTGTGVITITGQDDLRQAIRDERARELCFEGIRKHDLIRWGIFETSMQQAAAEPFLSANTVAGRTASAQQRTTMAAIASKMTEKYRLFPIPQKELNLNNKMKQNRFW